MVNSNKNYWKIIPDATTETLMDTYRFDEDSVIHHTSQLTMVYLDISSCNEVHIRQADLNSCLNIKAEWQGEMPPHNDRPFLQRHDHYELIYVVSGLVKVHIEDALLTFAQGDAFLLNRYTRNAIVFQEPSKLAVLCISAAYLLKDIVQKNELSSCKRLYQFFINNISENFKGERDYMEFLRRPEVKDQRQITDLFYQIYCELRIKQTGFSPIVHGLVLRIISQFENDRIFSIYHIFLGATTNKDLVDEIKSYLDQHPYRLELSDISEVFHYSSGYLAKIFKIHVGLSLSQYNRQVYMTEAKRLLAETDESISTIAAQVGYVNRTQFYKQFQNSFDITPKKYREKRERDNL